MLYTVPQLASVGLSEPEARAQGARVVNSDMASWRVYAIYGEPVARAKVIVAADTGRILGAHILGPSAGETIHLFALALRFGITAEQLGRAVYGYPTLASALPHTLG